MKQLVPINEHGLFADNHDTARVDSRYVAEAFNKRHDRVLRAIKNLECSDAFRLTNYGESSYINEQGKKQPCVCMTRNGFIFLAMGFTGKKAAQFKEAYIKQFDAMESLLKTIIAARTEFPLLTANIKLIHDEPRPYHFSNECDMLNRLVLGMTAKQFREKHGIEKGDSIRPYLSAEEIEKLETLQKVDIGLLISVSDFEQRKRHLEWYLMKTYPSASIPAPQEAITNSSPIKEAPQCNPN